MVIEFTLPIPPVAKERARYSKYGAYTPARTREFSNKVASYAKRYAPSKLLSSPLRLYCEFHLSRPKKTKFNLPGVRPDNDNYLKALMDALNGIIWTDDSLICDIRSIKLYALDGPKIKVKVEEIQLD